MKNSWIIWVVVIGLAGAGFVIFNQRQGKMPNFDEVFPEMGDTKKEKDIQYEFDEPPSEITTPTPTAAVRTSVSAQPKAALREAINVDSDELLQKVQEAAPTITGTNVSTGGFTIQVASFQDRAKAEKVLADLTKKNYAAFIVTKNVKDKGQWHRIYIGQYPTKQEATDALMPIKTDYPQSFVIANPTK